MSRTPELSDPRTYVSNQGIVELRYGVEKRTVEWQQDLYDYVRESLAEDETIDPEFCRKDKETGKRYWFACIVCPCNSYKDEDLVSHVKGHKHQKRVIEKLNSQSNLSRNAKRKRSSDYQESSELGSGFSRPSNSRSKLQNRIMYGPDYPFLGLEYITEYINPGNPNKDPMYTCSLEGCKSAWGSASIMYNHLTSNKNKHNRSYLTKYYEIPNLTVDQIFNKSCQVFEEKRQKTIIEWTLTSSKSSTTSNTYSKVTNIQSSRTNILIGLRKLPDEKKKNPNQTSLITGNRGNRSGGISSKGNCSRGIRSRGIQSRGVYQT